MNIANNPEIERKCIKLIEAFKDLATHINKYFADIKNIITYWQHSLGPTHEFIPYELIVPSISKEGKKLKTLTDASKKSKNLISYGFNQNDELVMAIRNYGGDADSLGMNVRFSTKIDGKTYILNAHIFESSPNESKLISACEIHSSETHTQYISITPPYDRYVRIDHKIDNRIVNTSTWATSWFKPLSYAFIYDENDQLSKIMIDEHCHWSNKT